MRIHVWLKTALVESQQFCKMDPEGQLARGHGKPIVVHSQGEEVGKMMYGSISLSTPKTLSSAA